MQRLLEEAATSSTFRSQPKRAKLWLHLLLGDGEEVERAEPVGVGVRLSTGGEALERVGHDHRAFVAQRVEHGTHEDRRAAAPRARLDRVALDAVRDDVSTQAWRSSSRRRPTIVRPCSGQSMPGGAQPEAVAVQLASHHGAVPASRRPTP